MTVLFNEINVICNRKINFSHPNENVYAFEQVPLSQSRPQSFSIEQLGV